MARRKRARRKVRKARVRKTGMGDLKYAIAILIFGSATAFSAVYELGASLTILLGLVTVAAALAMIAKKK